ncbi:MAG: deoxyribonuclease IV [Ignavibacteria bacterium]|nr:deoxyribonuclease IV [Ignavibacteria bacterium]
MTGAIRIFHFMSLLLGAHMSIGGGLHTALERGAGIGCTAIQIFTKNSNRWRAKPLSDEDIRNYERAKAEARIDHVVTHASYLINLCSTNSKTAKLAQDAFVDELTRCEQLGIRSLIFHPGSHTGAGEDEGLRAIAAALDRAHEVTAGFKTESTLETTAGQGTNLGYRFEQLARIIDMVREPERVAVCMDTCHLFAAGYPIHTEEGWEETMNEAEKAFGLSRVIAFHVNDSKKGLGSKIDRHEHIGKGEIGLTAFRMLMNDNRFTAIPKILETEKEEDLKDDVVNMNVLRSLLAPA